MKSDLIERLRRGMGAGHEQNIRMNEAADELERLRRELAEARGLLRDIAEMRVHVLPSRFMDESMAEAARAFLAGDQSPG